MLDLYQTAQPALHAECLLDETKHCIIDVSEVHILSRERKPLGAILHWDGDLLPSILAGIIGNRGNLCGVDLSSFDENHRLAAVLPALQGLSQGIIDIVILSTSQPLLEACAGDSDFLFVNFRYAEMQLTAVTKQLRHVAGLFSGYVPELDRFEIGISLKEINFIEDLSRAKNIPGEPFRRVIPPAIKGIDK